MDLDLLTFYTEITGISPTEGSVRGDTILTITGRFFDQTNAPAKVLVGGHSCEVLSIMEEKIICRSPAQPNISRTVFPGGRGLKLEVWNNSRPNQLDMVLTYNENSSGYQGVSWVDTTSYRWPVELDTFVARLSGFIVVPETDNYRFYIKGDDRFALYFSETGHPEDKIKIAYRDRVTNSYFSSSSQASTLLALQRGKEYYIEIYLQEYNGEAYEDVGIYRESSSYTEQQTADTVNEVQVIQTHSTVILEKQVLTLQNWTTSSAINEVQTVTVESSCFQFSTCSSHWYRLIYNMEKTVLLQADASAIYIESALNALWSIKPDTVQVKSTAANQGYIHTITFRSKRGDFNPLHYEVYGGSNITVKIEEQVKGKPSLETFTLMWEDVSSKPLSSQATAEEVKVALEEMVSVKCPDQLVQHKEGYAVKYFQDYETNFEETMSRRGQLTLDTAAFCGRYSLKNPSVLFEKTDVAASGQTYDNIPLATYSQFCFAYKGFLLNRFQLRFQYLDTNKITQIDRKTFSYTFAQGNDWSYTCIDLLKLLQNSFEGESFLLEKIILYKATSSEDFFVDTVYIGQKATVTNINEIPERKPQALASKGIFFEQFSVIQINSNRTNKYELTMTPFHCGHDIPLLAIGFAQADANNTQNESLYRGTTWPGKSAIHVQRVQAASPPVTGTFDIQAYGKHLDGLHANISASGLQYSLQSISSMGQISVSRSGSCAGYRWTIKWISQSGKQPLLQINSSNLNGVDVSMTIKVQKEGGLFNQHVLGDVLRTPNTKPQVEVFINGIPSKCSGDCVYTWNLERTPFASGITPMQGSYAEGTILTISGSGFSNSTANDMTLVSVGSVNCPTILVTESEITCKVGNASAGSSPVTVYIAEQGLAENFGNYTFNFTYQMQVSGVSPSSGSLAGGTLLTISGYGFSQESVVSVGMNNCTIVQADLSKILCRTPAGLSGQVEIVVTTNEINNTVSGAFIYDVSRTPLITYLNPTMSSIMGGVDMIIEGSNFGNLTPGNAVYIGKAKCPVVEWTPNNITCSLPKLPPGMYNVQVEVEQWGYANVSTSINASVEFILKVTDIFPLEGSLYGGNKITVTGSGFSTTSEENIVQLGTVPCKVMSASMNKLECAIQPTGSDYIITNNGSHPGYGIGYAWEPSSLDLFVGDTVIWKWQTPDFIMDIGYNVFSVASPSDVTYDGKGFISGSSKTTSGILSYRFTFPGTYYYSSGYINNEKTIFMQGAINVLPAPNMRRKLYLSVGGIEAVYRPGVPMASRKRRSASSCIATAPQCSETSSGAVGEDGFSFLFSSCLSPSIIEISPSNGTVLDAITISGTGFSNEACANEVTIGGHPCIINESTGSLIKCTLDPENTMDVGIAQLVSVTVNNFGIAINTLTNEFDRRFVLLPYIDHISPNGGSTTGRTKLSIHGSGFTGNASNIKVLLDDVLCTVMSVNYTYIECSTPPASTHNAALQLSVHGVPAHCKGSCSYSFSDSVMPFVTSVSPAILGNTSTELLITGTEFGNNPNDVGIYIGGLQVNSSKVTDGNISCTVGPMPVGTYNLQVVIFSKGLASGSLTVTSPATAEISPLTGSINGGTTLFVMGNGFVSGSTAVKIGNSPCQVISVAPGEVQCITPANPIGSATVMIVVQSITYQLLTFTYTQASTPNVTSVTPTSGQPGTLINISGSNFGSLLSDISVMIGDVACNVIIVSDNLIQCIVGNHAGGSFPVRLRHALMGYAVSSAVFQYELKLISISPAEGSFGGGVTLTVTGFGFDQQNSSVIVCDNKCKVNREKSTSNTLYCEAPANYGTDSQQVCNVTVANINDSVMLPDAFSYKSSLTPIVTSVYPRRGGTAGGTKLTITGSGFSSNSTDINVTVAQAPCTVQSANSTHIICITSAQTPSQETKVRVNIENKGISKLDNADFFYIDVWSSKYTWGGESPPEKGMLVVISKGQTILLDQSTPVLKMLLIQGGKLVFDEADIELQAENILITDGGVLQIGTESSPFQHKAIITLHGHLRSPELPVYGAKTLAVREGILDLHGFPVSVIWTHLAQTAEAGSSQLVLQQPVEWKIGNEIVIASTGHRHSQRENEKKKIASVSVDGRTLTLTEPLMYTHLGISVTLPDGTKFEGRAEIGLLTRNILVRGSDNIEWSDEIEACPKGFDTGEFATQACFQGKFGEEIGSDQFGGCIMFHAQRPSELLAIGRIEYVEIFHAGQAFRLGRYPIHWHMMGDMHFKSYVKGCAIHQTYNRAVTIHNTHHLLVENNVIYDIMGGAFFIEDGIEHGNVLQYNLAVFVRQSTSLLNDDVTPAAFWVTNPNNTVRHNAAAGGTHFGFWYRMHDHPDGASYDPQVCQKHVPLGEFFNNTVHSQGWFGLWIFEEYYPMQLGSCSSKVPEPAKFDSLTTWNCEKGSEWVNGGALQFHNFLMVNNEKAGIEMKQILASHVGGWGESTGAMIKDAKIVGHIDELGLSSTYCTSRGIILPFNEGLTVSSVKFMNFDRSVCAAVGVTSIAGHCMDRCGGWSAKFDGVQYFNSSNKASFRWEHEVVLIDADGSLTGNADYKVVPSSSLLDPSHCIQKTEWSVGFPGFICDSTVGFHRLAFNNPSPSSLQGKNVIMSNSFGTSIVPYLKKRLTHKLGWMALVPYSDTINWYFQDVDHITNISYSAKFYGFKVEDYVLVSHNFTQRPDMFNILDIRNESLAPLSWANNSNGDWYFEDNSTTLYYLVSGKKSLQRPHDVAYSLDSTMVDVNVQLQVYQCFFKDCVPPPPPTIVQPPSHRPAVYHVWSNNSFWISSVENNNTIPREGSNVIIPPGMWVVADTDIPSLHRLTIYGVLELEDEITGNGTAARNASPYRKIVLNATYISIQGGRLIGGWIDEPFKGELDIVLRGSHATPEWPLPNGPNQGSKVLGVFGGLDLHGIPHSLYKTKLANTVVEGSWNLSVMDAVDWKVGDEVLITTTSYDSWQTETRIISAVSSDRKSLALDKPLAYTHIAETYQVPESGQSYTLAADVGLLSRNIKIIGEDYPDLYKQSFGARVLVSKFTSNSREYKGYARISNVEFYHSGQEGYRDFTDPRYSVAFLNLGEIVGNDSSYLRGCAFHHGFSPAIGVFGTDGLDIDDNVIHFTVGEGIRIWGNRNKARRNLVALAIWPGTYNGREEINNLQLWHASIEVNEGKNIVLQDNVVAGFERIGYHIDGEPCPDQSNPSEAWFNNEAHGGLFGVYMNQDGLPGCSYIQEFTAWKCWDYGIYFQTTESVQISNVTLVDNGMGIFSIIYTPSAMSHENSNKTVQITKALIVGSSPNVNCSDALTAEDPNIKLSMIHRSSRPLTGGRSGICWPTFASAHNRAPGKAHAGLMSYNAITGRMTVQDSTFVGFKSVCSGEMNVMFMTNPLNEDLQHPVHVKKINIVNSTEQAKIFIHRPDLGKVNPSDCVDMDCDAKKKALFKDLDGSFLGGVGSVVPQAEYEWDGDKQHGVGDYRIPKVMLTYLNGSRIPVSSVAPHKGIIRDSSCTYMPQWQSYKCFGLDYQMLVIESLDSDSETRRLSPVALLADGYVDLINGPQDHGWCSGYTCQRRVSLFHGIVATNKSYEIYFSSVSPQTLRVMMLNTDGSKVVHVATYYSTSQRLDVYMDKHLIAPTNAVWNSEHTDYTLTAPTYPGEYMPKMNSSVPGENYFDRTYQMLHILVKGSNPIEIQTTPVLFLSFRMPAITPEHFYSDNLIQNLAIFLKVPANKIRITNVIRENSRRKKRATGLTVEIQIAEPPSQQPISSKNSTGVLQYSDLQNMVNILGEAAVVGNLSSSLGYEVSSVSISNLIPPPSHPLWNKLATAPVERNSASTNFLAYVAALLVVDQPVAGSQGQPLSQQPCIMAVDTNGNCVSVGITSMILIAILKDTNNASISGLSGNTTIPFSGCWANYTDLTLNKTGVNVKLEFLLNDIQAQSRTFRAEAIGVGITVNTVTDTTHTMPTTYIATTKNTPDEDTYAQRTAIIVGCVVGGILFIIVVVIVVLIVKKATVLKVGASQVVPEDRNFLTFENPAYASR
nr:PREDICTED: fibrocystin-L [Latimeria chalumnae]|eukprot:XP_014351910.1 PREDICTED: fibrocystin-L [Latimeria chalumnae]